jgi:hypothetical protein
MKKKTRIFIISVTAIASSLVILLILVSFLNPLIRSDERVREYVLKHIPLGTDMQEAIRIAERKRGWGFRSVSENFGIVIRHSGPKLASIFEDETIGVKSMSIYLGEYYSIWPFGAVVVAFFAFDENDKLIEIAIRKESNK